jgi:hypothetical protein
MSGFFNHPLDTIKLRIQTAEDAEDLNESNNDNDSEYNQKSNRNHEKNHKNGYNGSSNGNNHENDYDNKLEINSNFDDLDLENNDDDKKIKRDFSYNNDDNLKNRIKKKDINISEHTYMNISEKKKTEIPSNLFTMGKHIIREEGFLALFSGIYEMMYSTIFSSAFFCIIYEMIKRQSLNK